jgi:CheY-like chemotaxis protein
MAATILCVEDEDALRKDIVEELRDAGYETIEAENGKIALDAILKQRPDLIISDISMPVMGGYELLEEIRANHPERCEVPFVFLTALADRSHVVMGKKLGVDDYLTKPVDYEILLATVEARLEHAGRMIARHKEQLVKVYKAAVEEVGHAPCGPSATPKGHSTGQHDVAKHLQDLVTGTPTTVVAGRVQILGLNEFKMAFGDRWDRHGEMVLELIEQTIRKRLAPADVFQRDRDSNFTICFAELSESEAAFKARAIADEVRAKILGKDMGQGTAPLTAEADAFLDEVAGKNRDRPALGIKGEAHEIELAVDEVEGCDDLLGLLTSRLVAAAEQAKKAERNILMEIADHSTVRLHGIENRDGDSTPFHIADFDQDTQAKIEALRSHRPASEDLLRDLDVLLVTKVAEEVFRRPPGKNVILVANVHFSTLNNKRRLEHLKAICNTLTEPARAALVFNIVEIPAELLPAKVAENFFSVRHFCRAIMAQCTTPKLGNIDPQLLRTPILTFKAWDLVSLATQDRAAVLAFVKQLRDQKVRLLVYGITSRRELEQVKALGVEFVSLA